MSIVLSIPELAEPILSALPKLSIIALIDILATAFLIYQFLLIIRGRRAAHILIGIMILVAIYIGALWFGLEMLRRLLATLAPYTAFALIVVFQSELRRVLARMGRQRWLPLSGRLQRGEFTAELLLAVDRLSQRKTGALIVLERNTGLRTFVESGIVLDAQFSRDLLLTIFHPNTALHDGAVIIQGERIVAAACFLPLSTNPALKSKLGTRHRAAIGVTEETDCLAIVVSEETGRISLAAFGELIPDLTLEQLDERMAASFGSGLQTPAASADDISAAPEARPSGWGPAGR